jgi:hypothetical protein
MNGLRGSIRLKNRLVVAEAETESEAVQFSVDVIELSLKFFGIRLCVFGFTP